MMVCVRWLVLLEKGVLVVLFNRKCNLLRFSKPLRIGCKALKLLDNYSYNL